MNCWTLMSCVGVLALSGCSDAAPPTATPSVSAVHAAAPATLSSPTSSASSGASASSTPPVASPAPPGSDQRVIATVNQNPVHLQELTDALVRSHGLTMLLNLIQLDLVKADATKNGITVSAADIQAERDTTLSKMFEGSTDKLQDQLDSAEARKDQAAIDKLRPEVEKEHAQLFRQLLEQQHLTNYEFDMFIEMNTYIHKIVEPQIAAHITEKSLRSAFDQLYGETVKVRMIQLATPLKVQIAKQRLARGDDFGDVAKAMSENQLSGSLRGELPAFSRQTQALPEPFRKVAFDLKEGQVSDPVVADGVYYIIKLEQRNAPKVVTFESQKENVRHELMSRALAVATKNMRAGLAIRAWDGLKIQDPILAKQFEQEKAMRAGAIKDRDQMRAEMDRQREQSATQPAGQAQPESAPPVVGPPAPATGPGTGPAKAPANVQEPLRPPATKPAIGASSRPTAG